MAEEKKSASSSSYSSSSSSSSYSITERLFGSTQCSDTTEVMNAIFSPKSRAKAAELAANSTNEPAKKLTFEEEINSLESEKHVWGEETLYGEQRVNNPCGLSSSIYYGGQDFYHPPGKPIPPPNLQKDIGDENTEAATRGDWWQGSLYY